MIFDAAFGATLELLEENLSRISRPADSFGVASVKCVYGLQSAKDPLARGQSARSSDQSLGCHEIIIEYRFVFYSLTFFNQGINYRSHPF
jgi:hypothetical protein